MKLYLYHGTNKDSALKIQEEGFNVSDGRWGSGVYFTTRIEDAKIFGEYILLAEVEETLLLSMEYNKIAEELGLSIDDEEGAPELESIAKEKGYDGISVRYSQNDFEICIYNPRIISKFDLIEN